jgi:CRISPR system Cascade subunit CasA
MKEIEFNLVEEPWIRMLHFDNSIEEVSLLDALRNAHQYADLGGELPTQNVAILRLMLAVLHTVFSRVDETGAEAPFEEPDDALERWETLWNLGAFPEKPIADYLQTWKERFWLFHPERPFGQVPEAKIGTQNSVAKLDGTLSESNHKVRLFPVKAMEHKESLSYAEAARWLLHINGFDDAALKPKVAKELRESPTAVGWLGKLGIVYACGENLFETLMLNLVLLRETGELWGEEKPAWELDTPRAKELAKIPLPDNQAQLLTLQSRRILLEREQDAVVRYVEKCGDFFEVPNAFAEQMTVWNLRKKTGEYMPQRHQASKQMWRDFANLFLETEGVHIPGVVQWVQKLKRCKLIEKTQNIQFFAVSARYDTSQESAVTDILGDSITFRAGLLDENGLLWKNWINEEIHKCDETAGLLRWLATQIFYAGGGNASLEESDLAASVTGPMEEAWYAQLDGPFRQWLASIDPETSDKVERIASWRKTAKNLAYQLANERVQQVGTAAILGRTVTVKNKSGKEEKNFYSAPKAFLTFQYQLRKIYPEG